MACGGDTQTPGLRDGEDPLAGGKIQLLAVERGLDPKWRWMMPFARMGTRHGKHVIQDRKGRCRNLFRPHACLGMTLLQYEAPCKSRSECILSPSSHAPNSKGRCTPSIGVKPQRQGNKSDLGLLSGWGLPPSPRTTGIGSPSSDCKMNGCLSKIIIRTIAIS